VPAKSQSSLTHCLEEKLEVVVARLGRVAPINQQSQIALFVTASTSGDAVLRD
jgi:hypothetical protein